MCVRPAQDPPFIIPLFPQNILSFNQNYNKILERDWLSLARVEHKRQSRSLRRLRRKIPKRNRSTANFPARATRGHNLAAL